MRNIGQAIRFPNLSDKLATKDSPENHNKKQNGDNEHLD